MGGQAGRRRAVAPGGGGTGGGAGAAAVAVPADSGGDATAPTRPAARPPAAEAAGAAGPGRPGGRGRAGSRAGRARRTCGSTSGRSSTPERCGCRWTMWTPPPARPPPLVTAAGGFVGGDQRRSADADAGGRAGAAGAGGEVHRRGRRDRELGRQQRREINTEDVTEETVDLDARITTQRARVESARRLLARASSIGDLVSLENELGRREADLASLEAKKRRLADLTALSTITVTLVGPDAAGHRGEGRDRLPGRAQGRLEGVRRLADASCSPCSGRCCPGWWRSACRWWLLLRRGCAGRAAAARDHRPPAGAGAVRPGPPVAGQRAAASARKRGLHHDADAGRDGPLVHVEAGPVQVDVGAGAAHAEPGERAGDVLQVPGEVLAAHALRRLGDPVRAERGGGGGGEHPDGPGVVARPAAGRAGIPGRRWHRSARSRPGPPERRSWEPAPRCPGRSPAGCRRRSPRTG